MTPVWPSLRWVLSYILASSLCLTAAEASTPEMAGFFLVNAAAMAPPQPGTPAESNLRIVVLNGKDGVNVLSSNTTVRPVIEVRDGNDKPIVGALVSFTTPAEGAGIVFGDGSRTTTGTTDFDGRVALHELKAVNTGHFEYQVVAVYHEHEATIHIAQTNVPDAVGSPAQLNSSSTQTTPAPTAHKMPRWVIVALIGGAVAGVGAGVGLAGHSGAKAAVPQTSATVSPGSGATVGAP